MEFLSWITLFFFIAASGAESGNPVNIDLSLHLPAFEQQRYPLEEPYKTAWQQARDYITKEFESYGLLIHSQNFQTEVSTFDNTISEVDGMNIIGESQSTIPNAPIFIIGTYYDSTFTNLPLKENGVSLAVLLETAKNFQLLKKNGVFNQNTTILFVAFDLNIKNYIPEGPGNPGCSFFVGSWLSEYMSGRKFLGAVILDSISTFNTDPNTQTIPNEVANVFPKVTENIKLFENKADFLAVFSRSDLANQFELHNLMSRFQEVNTDGLYRMEDFTLPDGVRLPKEILNKVTKNAVHNFWTSNPPLPAMLLTDLEKSRIDFDHLTCSDNCSLKEFWTEKRSTFAGRTAEAILQLLLHNQQTGNDPTAPVIPSGSSQSVLYVGKYFNILLLSFYLICQFV